MKATIFRAIGLGLALTMLLAPFTASVSAAPVPRLRRETSPSPRPEARPEGSVEARSAERLAPPVPDEPARGTLPAWAQSPALGNDRDRPAVPTPQPPVPLRPVIGYSTRNDVSPPLRSIPPKPLVKGEPVEIPRFPLPGREESKIERAIGSVDAAVQNWAGVTQMPPPIQSFDGLDNDDNQAVVGFRVMPPDTQGDVGPNHYVQWVNLVFGVWDKDGHLLYGPAAGNTLWTGFGGPCEANNDGDIITLYDPLADRWMMSQFALNFPNDFHQCIAISQTPDPMGAWYRYDFLVSTSKMNDYPKFGVWPDAYYMTANQFDGSTSAWAGQGVWAFERGEMLQGNPAQVVYFDLYSVNPGFGGTLPADLDGSALPPAGAPGYFLEWDDSIWLGDPDDTLRLWEFHVDWATPANSTYGVSGQPNATVATADVDPDMCGFSRDCIPQPGTSQKLDAISDRLMYRVQYRNFGDYETLVSNHTVDADGTDHAGVHWLELRKSGGSWTMHQEGVYAPDSDHRWMGSIAMDKVGNIALGYSVSSGSIYPSVRYAGRLAGDPPGTLPQAEVEMVAGTTYHNGGNRWGDYSMMVVDPVDDCTFWYTQEYIASDPADWGNWDTRIGSFQFPGCLGPTGTLSGTVEEDGTGTPIIGAQVTAETNLTFVTYSEAPDGAYRFAAIPTGAYTVTAEAYGYLPQTFTGVDVISGAVTIQDFDLTPAAMYVVEGTVTDATTGWPLYASIDIDGYPGGALWSDPVTGHYSATLAEGTNYTFNVEAWVEGYLPASRDVGPLTGNETQDLSLNVDVDVCVAPGYELLTDGLYEDFETWPPGGWTIVDNVGGLVWDQDTAYGDGNYTGGNGHAADVNSDANMGVPYDTELRTPVLDVATLPTTTLRYLANFQVYSGIEALDLDVSTDGGGTWTNVLHWMENHGVLYGTPGEAVAVDLSGYLSGANNVLRWRYYTPVEFPWDWYAQVDEVRLGTGTCIPTAGGLVVGNVYDDNTSDPLAGAKVANEDGFLATTGATPGDPGVDDGFYTIFSPHGSRTFTATMTNYGPDVGPVTVVQSDTVKHDFYLPAGNLSYDPASLEVTLDMGLSTTLPFTLTNDGGGAAGFELIELDEGMSPLGPFEEPNFGVKPFKQNFPTTERLTIPDQPPAAPYAAGDVIQSWPAASSNPWGIAYTTDDTVWVGEGWGDDDIYEYLPDGTETGLSYPYPWSPAYGPADDAFDWNTGHLWTLDVGGDDCIHEMDPAGGYTGNTICPGFSVSQRGLAYDPSTDTYFAGSWNDLMIHHFAADGTMLDEVNVGLAVAGLAYNADTEHLFVIVNDDPNPVYVLDAADNYNLIGQFDVGAGFGAYGGAGLEMDCDGNLWAVDQGTNTVYQFESGETTTMCGGDVPWLSEDPVSGTVPSLASQSIDVTFDAGEVDQPGTYYAQLKIDHDTPYDMTNVPVTMTVNPPATWGKLDGTVTGLGHCDADPAPLEGAQVLVESWMTETITVTYPITLMVEDFEASDGGFIPAPISEWEWGIPTFPAGISAHSGVNVWGTDLDADADDTIGSHRLTATLTIPANATSLEWWDWYGDEASDERQLYIDGVLVWDDNGGTDQTYWAQQSVDVSAWAGQIVDVVFALSVCCTDPGPEGWYIDDVSLIGYGETQVDVPVSWLLETGENGAYQVWMDEAHSPLTVTVTYPDHETGQATGVIIAGQVTTTVDFDLRWLQPCVGVSPASVSATLDMGLSTTLQMSISNSGAASLEFTLQEQDRGFAPAGGPLVINVPPAKPIAVGEAALHQVEGQESVRGYRYTIEDQHLLAGSEVNVLLVHADDYPTQLKAFLEGYPDVGTVDTWDASSGGGSIPVLSDLLPYDVVIAWNNLPWADPDLIGDVLADYHDVGGNVILTVDAWSAGTWRTGGRFIDEEYTPFLSLGGAVFNDVTLGWYDAGHALMDGIGTSAAHFHNQVDLSTAAALVAEWDDGMPYVATKTTGGHEAVGINTYYGDGDVSWTTDAPLIVHNAIAYLLSGDVLWLSENPITGTVPADGGPALVDVTLDADYVDQPGDYLATLSVVSDDPVNGNIGIPVTMTVDVPATWGKLQGLVTGLGHCDADPAPLEGAQVLIENGVTVSVTTGVSGTYVYWLEQGAYTVTVFETDHVSDTAVVNVTAGMTTTQDFSLRWLRPCISVTPLSMEATVLRGTSETQTLTLSNDGAAATVFEMREKEGAVWPPSGPVGGHGEWLYQAEKGVLLPTNQGGTALAYPAAYRWEPDTPSQLNVLVYADDAVHPAPDTFLDQALQALGMAYTAHYDGDFAGFQTDLATGGPWDLVLVGHDNYGGFDTYFTDLDNYVTAGGKLIINTWEVSDNPGHALWITLGTTWIGDDSDPPDLVYWWEPGHAIFTDPESVPEFTSLTGGIYGTYGQHVEPLAGFQPLAGYTTPGPDPNQAAMILGNDDRTVFKGFLDGQNSADLDGDTLMDGVELWENIIYGLLYGFGGDVDWLSEDPITGTVGADSTFPVSITFTALPTMTSGVYTATLVVNTDDPANPRANVPVTMTVVAAPTCGFVSSSPDDLGETTTFTNTTIGDAPLTYEWDFGDGSTLTSTKLSTRLTTGDSGTSTAEHPTHTYAHLGLYTVVLTATNPYGEDVCTGTVSIEGVVGGFVSNSPVVLGDPVVFTNTTLSNPPAVFFFWTFGDSHSSSDENPVHTYAEPGTYTVTLFVANVPLLYAPEDVYAIYQDTVEVVASLYGVRIAPATASADGVSAVPVFYTLQVDNTGSLAETFDVTVSGNAWTTVAPPTIGPVAAGGSANLVITVTIPAAALLGATDVANVTVASQSEPAQSASATLTTTSNNIYGVMLAPSAGGTSGEPGATVTYTLRVTNTGNTVDTLTLAESGNAWATNVPSSIGPLASGEGADVQVVVHIPAGASEGEDDTVTVTATSQSDPTRSDTSHLTTTAATVQPRAIYLPLVVRHYISAPDLVVDSLIATSNAVTVTIRNQGNRSVAVEDEF